MSLTENILTSVDIINNKLASGQEMTEEDMCLLFFAKMLEEGSND